MTARVARSPHPDAITIDGCQVRWLVQLTPQVTQLKRYGGGEDGPAGPGQFKKLHIPDNEGKISFLRHNREGPAERPLDWGQEVVLRRIDAELAGKPPGQRRWSERSRHRRGERARLPGW